MVAVAWDEVPWEHGRIVRFYDLASTKPRTGRRDPDYTAGALVVECEGEFWLCDMVRKRDRPGVILDLIWTTWLDDWHRTGYNVAIRVEQEGGSGGAFTIASIRKHMVKKWSEARAAWEDACLIDPDLPRTVPETRPDVQGAGTGGMPKPERIRQVSNEASRGHWHIVEAEFTEAFLDEVEPYPDPDVHDDQIDAVAGAQRVLTLAVAVGGHSVERSDPPATAPTMVPVRPEAGVKMVRRGPAKRGTSFVVKS